MGVYITNANKELINNAYTGLITSTQKELLGLLGEVWNNQDFLNQDDFQTLLNLSRKGLY